MLPYLNHLASFALFFGHSLKNLPTPGSSLVSLKKKRLNRQDSKSAKFFIRIGTPADKARLALRFQQRAEACGKPELPEVRGETDVGDRMPEERKKIQNRSLNA